MGALRRLLEWRLRWCSKKLPASQARRSWPLGSSSAARRSTRVGVGAEDHVEHGTHRGCEILRVAGVVDEHAGLGEGERIARGRSGERQAVVASEHAGRADRQWIEGLGLGGQRARAGGQAHVEAAEGDADRPGDELRGEARRIGGRSSVVGSSSPSASSVASSARSASSLLAAEALGDGAAVGFIDAVEGEAALVDLGLDPASSASTVRTCSVQAAARSARSAPAT